MRFLLSLLMALFSSYASAESMRCGKWVVDEQVAPAEIQKKCGEPQDKRITKEDVVGKNALGSAIKLGVMTKEQWYYRPSRSALPMRVTIVDGKVTAIERVDQ